MLLVMFFFVGVTSAQLPVPSTTMTRLRSTQPSLERTTIGTANTQPDTGTRQLKPTLKMTIPSASTLPATGDLEGTSSGGKFNIPLRSTLQYQISESNTTIATSTNRIALPSSVTRIIQPGSMKGTPEDIVQKSTHQISTAPLRTTIEVPPTPPFPQTSYDKNLPIMSSKVGGQTIEAIEDFDHGFTRSIHPTEPHFISTYQVPTENFIQNSSSQRRSSDQAKNISTPDAIISVHQSTAVVKKKLTDKPHTANPEILKTVDMPDVPTWDSTMQGILSSETKTIIFPPTPATLCTQRKTIAPVKTYATRNVTSPDLPLPTEPLPSAILKQIVIPPTTVDSMHYLPWINQETTSILPEKKLDSVLHPTLPSVFSRRTKPLKSGRPRDMNRATTSSLATVSRFLSSLNERKPAYYKYKTTVSSKDVTSRLLQTTVPTSPVLNFQGNQSVLHSTSLPIGFASVNHKLSVIVPSLPLKTSSETLLPEILPTLAAMDSVKENLTQNCTNDYCVSDEDYIDMMLEYMFPTSYEWVMIGMHVVVFIGGLIGNALVCVAVYRNHSMRTVTNYFIVNLAVADFLVILLCLPPTVLWDVTETWFMGTALCKIVLYFQTVSVAVSVLTLTFISVDRWYAICCPLKFKSTTGRAKTAILVIWVLALAFDIPELVVLQTKRKQLSVDTLFFTQCEPSWSDKTDMAFHCLQTLLLYTIPLVFMSIAYCQIVRVLWSSSNIPGHKERLDSSVSNGQATSCRSDTIDRRKKIDRCASVTVSTTCQVITRRKAAKMLVAVVIMFAVCYFPVHLLSILRYTLDIPQTDATTAFAMVSHWLCYANSAVNPLIYNFMSGKFRKEFAHAFGCCRISWRRPAAFARRRRRRPAVASCGDWRGSDRCGDQRAEIVPLSGGCATNIVIDIDLPC